MSHLALRVIELSKRYRIGAPLRYKTLRDGLAATPRKIRQHIASFWWRKNSKGGFVSKTHIWALRQVSFEIKRGEIVGIIGRNGAGKSTLLKILSRITEPTSGYADCYGRVGSLLEIGTGFHPELTGRENIYLNGAVLGMKKAEISKKFDEIVAFAEVDKFLDTPIKQYSSGMYVRLAFAVAAHLEPEILLIDEVLAVGDIAFQRKCLARVDAVSRQGRTVLFVSHDLGAIARLCSRSLWLEDAKVKAFGSTQPVVLAYQSTWLKGIAHWRAKEKKSAPVRFDWMRLINGGTGEVSCFTPEEPIRIEVGYTISQPLEDCQIGIRLYDTAGHVLFTTADTDAVALAGAQRLPGEYAASVVVPGCWLSPGIYSVYASAHAPNRCVFDVVEEALVFDVSPAGSLKAMDGRQGFFSPRLEWETLRLQPTAEALVPATI